MQKKIFIYVVLCICAAFLFSGCGRNTGGPENNTETPTTTVPVATVTVPLTQTVTPSITEEMVTIAPLQNREITIYTLNPDSLEKEAITVLVEEGELTPEFVVEQVVAAMEDEAFYLGINDIISEGDSVRIDFKSDAAPVTDVGASVEGAILDILGQSILDNLPQYKKIYVSIEGGPYQTGHLEFELDDVYIGR